MTKLEKLYELANGVKEFDLKSKEAILQEIKHSNNLMKKEFLEKISKALNLGWKVEMLGKRRIQSCAD